MNEIPPSSTPAAKPSSFSLMRVMLVAVPILLLVVGGGAYFLVFDGKLEFFEPKIYTVTGTVTWNGQPIERGELRTKIVGSKYRGADCAIKNGEFKFETNVKERWVDGGYAGTHQIAIRVSDPNFAGMGASPLVSPAKYADFETSGLTVELTENVSGLVLAIEGGEMPQIRRPSPSAAAPVLGDPGSGLDRELAVLALDLYDADQDSALDEEEQKKLPLSWLSVVKDENEDGKLDHDELVKAAGTKP